MAAQAQEAETQMSDEDQLEQRVDRLEGKLDRILSMLTSSGSKPDDKPASKPEYVSASEQQASVAEQVRAELARADREKSEAAEKESVGQRLARLEEKTPEPPQPRRQRITWGAR